MGPLPDPNQIGKGPVPIGKGSFYMTLGKKKKHCYCKPTDFHFIAKSKNLKAWEDSIYF